MDVPSSASSALQNPSTPALRPTNSAAFKRENRRKRKERKRQEKLQLLLDDWAPLADQCRTTSPISTVPSVVEWPVEPETDKSHDFIGWNVNPIPQFHSPSSLRPASAESLAQENAIRLCREFFSTEDSSDGEVGEEFYINGGKIYEFFKDLFDKKDLIDFYRKDREQGEFYCIVCRAIGETRGKKFGSLTALLQHANFISKTNRIMAHRAYGRVVCELLGMEIDRFNDAYLESCGMQSQDGMEEEDNNGNEIALEDAGIRDCIN